MVGTGRQETGSGLQGRRQTLLLQNYLSQQQEGQVDSEPVRSLQPAVISVFSSSESGGLPATCVSDPVSGEGKSLLIS